MRFPQAPLHQKSPHAQGGFPIESWRVAPKILEAVKRTFISMKHVHDHLQVIEHDPLTGGKSVNCGWSNRVVLF